MEHNLLHNLTKRIFFLTVIGFVFFLPNSFAAMVDTTQNYGEVSHKCTGNTCSVDQSEIVARITRYRDVNINPCDNFYRFACGNYKDTNKDDANYHLGAMANENIKKLVQKGTSSDAKPYKLIDDIYRTCVNKHEKGQKALELMKQIIKSLGNWPVLEANRGKEVDFDWIDFTGNAKKVGYNINFFLDWEPRFSRSEPPAPPRYEVKMPSFDFEQFMAQKSASQKQIYADYKLKIAQLLGATGEFAKDMAEVFDLEDKLLAIAESGGKCPSTDNLSVEELQQRWLRIDWLRFIKKTLTSFIETEQPTLAVWNSTALTELYDLMVRTPKRVQANYAIWKIVQYSIPHLTKEFTDAQKKFYQQVGYPEIPLDDSCVTMVKSYASFALQYLQLDQYKSSQATVRAMAKNIKNTMIKIIENSETFNDNVKTGSIKAIKETSVIFGPSEKLANPKELEKYYADARIVEDNFLQTILNLNLFKMKKKLGAKSQSEVPPSCADSDNPRIPKIDSGHLRIPAALIPGPFFNQSRPMSMNFGASGFFIAIRFAEFSLIEQNSTRQDDSMKKQLKCFQRYYDDLSDETRKDRLLHNRFDEDLIMSYLGFRSSWAAYQTYAAQNGEEAPLPGLPYSANQLFWISSAQSSCSEYHKLTDPRTLQNNQFNSIEYLMMKILSTVPEVSKDFQCSPGSNLNPVQRCAW